MIFETPVALCDDIFLLYPKTQAAGILHINSHHNQAKSAQQQSNKSKELPTDCDILSLHTPHCDVVRFITSFCVAVLPYKNVFGTRRNQGKFLSTLASYVALGECDSVLVG